jgi:hypothetical protein
MRKLEPLAFSGIASIRTLGIIRYTRRLHDYLILHTEVQFSYYDFLNTRLK